jgi:uncharacterized surface protein with fasciclin (FAS1) repeats
MNKLLLLLQVLLLSSVTLFVTSCGDDSTIEPPTPPPANNITDIVTNTERFSSLLAALEITELTSTIASGEYTVFAPDNDAFDTYLNGTPLADVDVAVLTQLLLNHVVAGTVSSTDLANGYVSTLATESTTMNNISMLVNIDNGVTLNNTVSVVAADIAADNGMIHEVGAVIAIPSVVDLAVQGDFSILVAALTRADLTVDFVGTLSGTGPFTVFAPTDAAFIALLDSNPAWTTLDDIPVATLEAVLKYHVVAGANVLSSTLTDGQVVTTFEGSDFTINTTSGATITDANGNVVNIVATDVQGSNGVVHVIDGVILP